MQKKAVLVMALLCLAYIIFSIFNAPVRRPGPGELDTYMNPLYWKNQALKDIIPFWEKTIDRTNGGFFNNVMRDGTSDRTNGKYPRMASRIIYGFSAAYMLSGDDSFLDYADHALKFLTNYGWDKINGGWYTYLDTNNEPATNTDNQDPDERNMFDEDYCNLGPVFYYFATGDPAPLTYVKKTHELIQAHVWDPVYKGYYEQVSTNWQMTTSMKSFSAQMDTCSAYLIYYYLAVRDRSLLNDIMRIADLVKDHMIDPGTGFVGERFYMNWASYETNLWAGHNLKAGWVLMRAYNLTRIKKYADTAEEIAKVQISNNWDSRYYGWFFRFSYTNARVNYENKDWWTQEEGDNLMLNLYGYDHNRGYLDRFRESAWFWDKYIVDHEYGECYPEVSRDGWTGQDWTKGDLYKSAYHTMEHALFNYLYLSLYIEKKDATLYFRIKSSKTGDRHYVVLTEYPGVFIKSVLIDGKSWKGFNAKEGYVTLPEGRNLKLKVTYSAL